MQASKPSSSPTLPTPLLFIALLLMDGTHFVWAKAISLYLPPLAATGWYFSIAAIEIGVVAAWFGKLNLATLRRKWWFFLAIGTCVAASSNINYFAARIIDPATGTLMTQSVVLYNLIFGLLWFKDKLTRAQLLGALLCMVGVVVISFQPGDYLRFGSLLVLGGSLFYSLHASLVKRFGADMDFLTFFAWRVLITALVAVAATTAQGAWQWPQGRAWIILFSAATLDVAISRALYYAALRRLNISMHTILLTASPVMAALWSYLFFSITPTLQQIIGAFLVMAGVALVSLARPH